MDKQPKRVKQLAEMALDGLLKRYDAEPDHTFPLEELLPGFEPEGEDDEMLNDVELYLRKLQVFGVRTIDGGWLLTDQGADFVRKHQAASAEPDNSDTEK